MIKHAFTNLQPDGGDASVTRPSDWNAAHVIDDDEATTGFADWTSGADADTYTITGGNFQIDRAGYGYVKSVRVDWVAGQQTSALTAWATTWVYIDSSGLIGSTTSGATAFDHNRIVLFEVWTDGTNYIVVKENHVYDFQPRISGYLHMNLNTIIRGTGATIAPVASGDGSDPTHRQVKVTGADTMDDHGLSTTVPDSAGAGITLNNMYINAAGKYALYSQSTQLPMYYNAGGTPTILNGVNEVFCAYPIYVSKDDIESSIPIYFSIMDSNAEDNLAAVINNIYSGSYQYATGELNSLELCQLGFIIMEYTAAGGRIADTIVAKSSLLQALVKGVVPIFSLTDHDHISAGLSITYDALDMSALPAANPNSAGKLYYIPATGVVMRSTG